MATHQDADKAVSWMLHALKIVLGDESIRRYIILYYYPTITNPSKKCIRTFDAFVESAKKREEKANEIRKYCNRIKMESKENKSNVCVQYEERRRGFAV